MRCGNRWPAALISQTFHRKQTSGNVSIYFNPNTDLRGCIWANQVTAIKIQIANSLVVRQMEPGILAYWTRNLLGVDMPL